MLADIFPSILKDKYSREVLRVALPAALMNLTIPLLGIVDTVFMGRFADTASLAGLAVSAEVFNVMLWLFAFLQMGTNSQVAQTIGRSKAQSMSDDRLVVLTQSIITALVIAMTLILLRDFISVIAFGFMNPEKVVLDKALQYFDIRIFAAPATLVMFSVNGYFIGTGKTMIPFVLTLFANVFNLALNTLFVLGMDKGIAGVAMATLCSQYLTACLGLGYALWDSGPLRNLPKPAQLIDLRRITSFFRLNASIFFRSLVLTFSFALFIRISTNLGSEILAVNNMIILFWTLCAYVLDGFAYAAISFSGQCVGAKDEKLFSIYFKRITLFSYSLALALGAFLLMAWPWLVDLMTTYPDVRQVAYPLLFWAFCGPILGNYAYLWDGVIVGCGDTKILRNAMLVAGGFFIGIGLTWEDSITNRWLWSIFVIFTFLRGALQHIPFKFRRSLLFQNTTSPKQP